MRLATTTSSSEGSSSSAARSTSSIVATVCVSPSTCTCSDRIPGVTSTTPATLASATHAASACGAQSQVEVEDHRPVLDQDGAVAALPVRHLRRVAVGGAHREHAGCVLGRR